MVRESTIGIRSARFPEDLESVRELFRNYASSLAIDLSYQGFEKELLELPGDYRAPKGALILAQGVETKLVGCVALRQHHDSVCEMKRLYVIPSARGTGLGRKLVDAIVGKAVELGYKSMVLDTLPTMTSALGMYRTFGFIETESYYNTPVEGTVFMALDLSKVTP